MHRRLFAGLILLLCCQAPALAAQCGAPGDWPEWTAFQHAAITAEGRVIDHSDPRSITTSEGQGYAMFFALVNNDQALFQRLLGWTEQHLAQGDLTAQLPAWLWGKREDGETGVIDANTASDADLWLAYVLLEAGRLWKEHRYAALGSLMAERIAREEVVDIPGLGPMLLPGKKGFVHDGYWVLNPSYVPPQLADRLAQAYPDAPWKALRAALDRMLTGSAPLGYAPDWTAWRAASRSFGPRPGQALEGSYDAIRVYLWLGMLAPDAPGAQSLKSHFLSIADRVDADGAVPTHINAASGDARGAGPAGFSAALLPLLAGTPQAQALQRHADSAAFADSGYYGQALRLFSGGWMQKRYGFDAAGRLVTEAAPCP